MSLFERLPDFLGRKISVGSGPEIGQPTPVNSKDNSPQTQSTEPRVSSAYQSLAESWERNKLTATIKNPREKRRVFPGPFRD